jgi:chromosome partitioning protein
MKYELLRWKAKGDPMAGRQAKMITVFNQKGGCAKTMTAMQLAGTLGRRGVSVFVVDMDPQNTAHLWALQASEEAFPAEVLSMAPLKEQFLSKLPSVVSRVDVVIVDCPPALGSRVPWVSLLSSDLAIIPVIPVMDNVWASKQAEELVEEARKENPSLQAVYLLSMLRRGKVFDQCLEILCETTKIPMMKARVSMRNVYPESQAFGCVVASFGKSPATLEMDEVADEVALLVGVKLKKGRRDGHKEG